MKALVILCLLWLGTAPTTVVAQSSTVLPSELALEVTVEPGPATPFTREMILITIRGVYRRHITREKLLQPDFEGFSWAQLGSDAWSEERIDGEKVKVFRRRMAIYPDRAGTLTIGAFTHQLTLTDEGDDWFDHKIQSRPITVEVAKPPPTDDWWFPVRRLRVEDSWSNAPDQLKPGEGVLRIVRIEALGVTPEMIPPMPELTSPTAMIFPHPDKRLVELTPQGPVTHAFWRWTIRPSNDRSTIVEPLVFSYFDTTTREAREVTINAQRVAYGTVTGPAGDSVTMPDEPAPPAQLPGWPLALVAMAVTVAGLALGLSGRTITGWRSLRRFTWLDPLAWQLRLVARRGDPHRTRRLSAEMLLRDGSSANQQARAAQIAALDRAIFDPNGASPDLVAHARNFLRPKQTAK